MADHTETEMTNDFASDRTALNTLNNRLHDIGWGLLLMMTGTLWLLPTERVPEGTWLFGVAAILLGINTIRYVSHIKVEGFSLFLGLAALIAALTRMWRSDLPLLALCFILIGASLIAKALRGQHA